MNICVKLYYFIYMKCIFYLYIYILLYHRAKLWFPLYFTSFKLPLPFPIPSPTSTFGFIWEITLLSQFKRRKIPTHVDFVTNCSTILMLLIVR